MALDSIGFYNGTMSYIAKQNEQNKILSSAVSSTLALVKGPTSND